MAVAGGARTEERFFRSLISANFETMHSVTIMIRKLVFLTLLAACLGLSVAACEPTPNYLDRWANREGSEDKFIGYLQSPETSLEVKTRALVLLVEQWQYSSSAMRNGEPLTQLEPDVRAQVVNGAIPGIREIYDESEAMQVRVRDAVYHISKAVDDAEARDGLRAIVRDWLENHWQPCRQVGAVTTSDLFRMLGPTVGNEIILNKIKDGGYEQVVCTLQSTRDVSWRNQSEEIAIAVKDKWVDGGLPDNSQARITFLDEFAPLVNHEPVKVWLFEQFDNNEIDALYRNYFVELLTSNRSENDIPRYVELLKLENNFRWMGVKALVDIENAAGLDRALNNLPVESDYAWFDGARRYDGFRRASNVVCNLKRLGEIEDQIRDVFEQHLDDENIYARVISIDCLGKYGDNESIEKLNAAKRGISRADNVEAPYWVLESEEVLTLHDLIDESITEIQTPDEEEATEEGAEAAEEGGE